MTPARIKALQWFHDRGETRLTIGGPDITMIRKMLDDLQVTWRGTRERNGGLYRLTDKGREDLHEATRK